MPRPLSVVCMTAFLMPFGSFFDAQACSADDRALFRSEYSFARAGAEYVGPLDLGQSVHDRLERAKRDSPAVLPADIRCEWRFLPPGPGEELSRVDLCILNKRDGILFSPFAYKSDDVWRDRMAAAVDYDLDNMPKGNREVFDLLVRAARQRSARIRSNIGRDKMTGREVLLLAVQEIVNENMTYLDDIKVYPEKAAPGEAEVEYWANANDMISRAAAMDFSAAAEPPRAVGDCEDYCIMKYVILRELGYPEDNMRILVHRLKVEHATLLAYDEDSGDWFQLDNRYKIIVRNSRGYDGEAQYLVSKSNITYFKGERAPVQ